MIDQFLKDEVLVQLRSELRQQEDFLNNMKKINSELESEGSPPLYSVQELVKSGELYIKSLQRTIAQLPLEDEIE